MQSTLTWSKGMNIIFDLDGTLIDSRLRLYRLIKDLAPGLTLSFDQYWAMKRSKISNESILFSELSYTQAQINDFVANWMGMIETPNYLKFDTIFEDLSSVLEGLNSQADLYVCTDRQLSEPVIDQLNSFNIRYFFRKIMVTNKNQTKESMIINNLAALNKEDWIVGDTGKDIQVGQHLNIQTCAVLNGFLSRNTLEQYSPDLIINSVLDFHIS